MLPAVQKESRHNHEFAEQSQFNYGSREYVLPNIVTRRKITQGNHMKIRIPLALLREKENSSSRRIRLRLHWYWL
jgi:hypothetical protein